MGSARSVHLTWLAVRYSLAPPPARAGDGVAGDRSPARRLRSLFADLAGHQDRQGCLELFLPGVHPVAAPAIMFHLKRTGWSACRVTDTGAGLHLAARR